MADVSDIVEVYGPDDWVAEGEIVLRDSHSVLIRFPDRIRGGVRADRFGAENWVREMDLDDMFAVRFRETLQCEC